MDTVSYLLGKKSGGGGDVKVQNNKNVTITENTTTTINPDSGYDALKKVNVTTNITEEGLYRVGSVEEMNEISNPNIGDLCIVQDKNLTPWILGETNSNVFCFPDEVDIEDIKDEIYSQYGGSIGFAGSTIDGKNNLYGALELDDNEFAFNIMDYEHDDKLRVEYSYINGKFKMTDFYYYYSDSHIVINEYAEGVITRCAYTINSSLNTPLKQDLFGRFVKTKENDVFKDNTSNCLYFPTEISRNEPFDFNGDFSIIYDNGEACVVNITPDSDSNYIVVGYSVSDNSNTYEWNDTTKKYELVETQANNVIFNPFNNFSKLAFQPGSEILEEEIEEIFNSGLLQMPSTSFPQLYIKNQNTWDKISIDGSPFEC